VKITDFGLAKLLDYDERTYHATGGKVRNSSSSLPILVNNIPEDSECTGVTQPNQDINNYI